jgi:hypothetical protein
LIDMLESKNATTCLRNFTLGLNAYLSRSLRGRNDACWAEGFFVLPAGEYRELCQLYFNRGPEHCYYFDYYLSEGRNQKIQETGEKE